MENSMNLATIQDISSNTGIPATTVRRYIQTFGDVLPQGTKLGRAWKYPVEMIEAVKIIYSLYQENLSTIEIRRKLSEDTALLLNDVDTTTFSPQGASSLQEDIRELTASIKILTETITLLLPLHHQKPTIELPPGHAKVCEPLITTILPPDDHKDDTKPMEDSEIPDCHGRDLTLEERDAILIHVFKLYPGKENTHKRAEVLNKAGVKCGSGKSPWNRKKVTDNHRYALKRQAAK